MIKSFADKRTHELFKSGKSKVFPPEILQRAVICLNLLHLATAPEDLRNPPSNRLHALSGNRAGQLSVSVNQQWRICFRFEEGNAYDVELLDYH